MKTGRNEPCWCGSGRKYKQCHAAFDEKLEKYALAGIPVPERSWIKTSAQIEKIRESCKINIEILDYVENHIREGISTGEIDRWVSRISEKYGAVPAPLNFQGYPRSVCTSINEVVCHGIPDDSVILQSGDIVNVDVSTILNGYFSDSSRMFCIGEVSPEKKRLVEVTRECVKLGVEQVRPWEPIGNMGSAVHEHAKANGFSVVEEIGGHGVGLEFHEDPWVSYVSERGKGVLMVPGMMFTIEPMINMGTSDVYVDEEDGWTVRTADGLSSAQWEVTVLVTQDGCEVTTW